MQNSVAPSEYTSDAGVGLAPARTSGAVNAGEPMITPVAVWKPPAILAIPKSVNCGSPYSVSRTLRGFQRTRQLHPDAQGLAPIHRTVPADQRVQRALAVAGHHDVRPAPGCGADLEYGHDVRMPG